jgi:amino acid transporter
MAMWFCGLSAVTWSSRVIWAFARDEGLPLSRVWNHVSQKHLTPAPAIWLCAIAAFLAAVYSGAYAVVTSISTIGYTSPMAFQSGWSRASELRAGNRTGPWHLGRFSSAINITAILWVIFLSVILCLAECTYLEINPVVTIMLGLWYGLRNASFQGAFWS